MKNHYKIVLISFWLLALLNHSQPVSAQCAMCKAVAKSNIDSRKNEVGKGINSGVFYLLVTPYLLVGGLAFYIYKNRKNREDQLPATGM